MLTKYTTLGLLTVLTAVPSAFASDLHALWTCSTDTETRTLSVGDKNEGGCELHYEKNEKVKVISWSSHSMEPCVRSRDKILGELKAAGWKCTKSK